MDLPASRSPQKMTTVFRKCRYLKILVVTIERQFCINPKRNQDMAWIALYRSKKASCTPAKLMKSDGATQPPAHDSEFGK
ncbi:hypothetical protein DFQ28_009916, partial [Apophysomyces sp. BC1034]